MKMKFGKTLLAAGLILSSNLASAGFYVGAGAYNTSIDVDSFEKYNEAYNIFAGWKPSAIPFLSVEASYHNLGSYKISPQDSADVSAWSAQGVFTFPITIIDIYAKLGISKTEYKFLGDKDDSSDPYYALGAALTMLPVVDIYVEYQNFELTDDISLYAYGLGVKANF
ncbi:MAG: outer membrane beta-barrel protein [Pseudomonadales bacterium]|nr:outer membrane beta-barrel protein [Pseudomonadales bacterium]